MKKRVPATADERLALIEMPYLRHSEICRLLGKAPSTVTDQLRHRNIKKYGGFGYLTDDIIRNFRLEGAIKRWRESARESA